MEPHELIAAAYALGTDARARAEADIDAWFSHARPMAIARLAQEARITFRHGVWRGYVSLNAPLDDARLAAFEPYARLAIAALLSVHRSGYVRELALRHLARASDPRVLPFLILRTDDIVTSLRERAEREVMLRLQPPFVPMLVACLGLIALLGARVRGGGGALVRDTRDFLARPEHAVALAAATRDGEPEVRRAAYVLRLRSAPLSEVLRGALADEDIRIRRFAIRTATLRSTSASDKRALLPIAAVDRAPSIRIAALRGFAALDDDDALERALLDHNAGVRYAARALLHARRPERPFGETRARALSALDDANTSMRTLVGALGALSDVGLRQDVERVRMMADDPRAAVRAEARRTVSMLER